MDSLLNTSPPPETPNPLNSASDSGGFRLPRTCPPPHPPPEKLPCPRCASTDTKFCYYNNYNLSQPRHLCKSCRRYWTRGGTLRNVPVGGAARRPSSSNKRRRTTAPEKPAPPAVDNTVSGRAETLVQNPSPGPSPEKVGELGGGGGGLFPFDGFGFGPGPDYEQPVLDWPMERVSDGSPGCDTWQMGGGECFGWPDNITMSTPAKAFK